MEGIVIVDPEVRIYIDELKRELSKKHLEVDRLQERIMRIKAHFRSYIRHLNALTRKYEEEL